MTDLSDDDLEIVTGCAAVHPNQRGGQHVAMDCTGVLVIHRPTGIAVLDTSERSQFKSKNAAVKRLRALLALQLTDEDRAALKWARQCVDCGSQTDDYYKLDNAALAVLDKLLLAHDRPDGDR